MIVLSLKLIVICGSGPQFGKSNKIPIHGMMILYRSGIVFLIGSAVLRHVGAWGCEVGWCVEVFFFYFMRLVL
jgi:hypothetical protein